MSVKIRVLFLLWSIRASKDSQQKYQLVTLAERPFLFGEREEYQEYENRICISKRAGRGPRKWWWWMGSFSVQLATWALSIHPSGDPAGHFSFNLELFDCKNISLHMATINFHGIQSWDKSQPFLFVWKHFKNAPFAVVEARVPNNTFRRYS